MNFAITVRIPIQWFHTSRLTQSQVTIANKIVNVKNHVVAHGNLPSITSSLPVCDTESDPHLGWLSLACETTS